MCCTNGCARPNQSNIGPTIPEVGLRIVTKYSLLNTSWQLYVSAAVHMNIENYERRRSSQVRVWIVDHTQIKTVQKV